MDYVVLSKSFDEFTHSLKEMKFKEFQGTLQKDNTDFYFMKSSPPDDVKKAVSKKINEKDNKEYYFARVMYKTSSDKLTLKETTELAMICLKTNTRLFRVPDAYNGFEDLYKKTVEIE